MIRVLIADDHPIVREGLRRLLDKQADISVVGEANDGDEVLSTAKTTSPDVVLLDVSMPGPGFLEVLSRLKRRQPRSAVLVLSVHPESGYGLRALEEGAAGYLSKNSTPAELADAVRLLARGKKYISPTLAGVLAEAHLHGNGPRHASLSKREYQVLRLAASGKTVKQIAQQLSLSPKTVSTYRLRILEKLRFETHAEVMRYAIENDLGQ